MSPFFETYTTATALLLPFIILWVFMDINHASRALWNACGSLTERVKNSTLPRRHSDLNLALLNRGEEPRPSTPERREAWLQDEGYVSPLTETDSGHFTEQEFLARYGSSSYGFVQEEKPEDIPDRIASTPMPPGDYVPDLSEPSALLDARECSALAAAVPIRHRWRRWHLLYSTGRDGISLQTLFRQGAKAGPSILVIRDRARTVFGCFCAEGWKVAPRYYGTGESFVFQVQPELQLWRWYQKRMARGRNDFFQFGTPDCLAIGGAPAYAIKLDGDLVYGRSGVSETFGNSPLASAEEFEIGRVELWGLF